MFATLKTVLKERVHPFLLLGVGLGAVLLITAFAGIWHHHYELSHQVQKLSSEPTTEQVASVASRGYDISEQEGSIVANVDTPASASGSPIPAKPASLPQNAQSVPPVAANNPAAPTVPATVAVSLSINGVFKGTVTLIETSNQCTVLQKALDTGVISSLDMRYSAQYKTYAVYVIEGQGDSGAIWWAYTVNGKSPPYGCSGTKVAAGDSVNWKYVKQ